MYTMYNGSSELYILSLLSATGSVFVVASLSARASRCLQVVASGGLVSHCLGHLRLENFCGHYGVWLLVALVASGGTVGSVRYCCCVLSCGAGCVVGSLWCGCWKVSDVLPISSDNVAFCVLDPI